MIPRIRLYIFIIIDNLFPLVGYFVLNWDLNRIFLFYAVELCAYELVMIPQIIIYSHTCGEYILYSAVKKVGLSISWLLYHLMLYIFTMMFLLHTAFVISPGAGAPATMKELWSFADEYSIVIVFIFVSYLLDFFTGYLRSKEYEVLPSDVQLKEIALFYFLLLIVLVLINGVAVAFSIDSELYQIVMMFIIIGIKTIAQVMLRKGKSKYIR
jgi:hypothetical protein